MLRARNDFAIDSDAFIDDDGQAYLFYATDFYDSDATTFRGTALVMDRLDPGMTSLAGEPRTVMRAHWPWQIFERDRLMGGVRADWYTLEGPCVVKRRWPVLLFLFRRQLPERHLRRRLSFCRRHHRPLGGDRRVSRPADHAHGPWQGARPGSQLDCDLARWAAGLHRLPRLGPGDESATDVDRPVALDGRTARGSRVSSSALPSATAPRNLKQFVGMPLPDTSSKVASVLMRTAFQSLAIVHSDLAEIHVTRQRVGQGVPRGRSSLQRITMPANALLA